MNASKFLSSTAAAVAVVGVIGLAYAQTTTEPSPGGSQRPISETMPAGQPAGPGLTPSPSPETSVQTTAPEATTPQATTPTMPSHPALQDQRGTPNATGATPMDSAAPPVERPAQADRN